MKYLIFLCPICLLNNFLSFQLFVFSALWSSQPFELPSFLVSKLFGPPKMSLVLQPPVAWLLILRTGRQRTILQFLALQRIVLAPLYKPTTSTSKAFSSTTSTASTQLYPQVGQHLASVHTLKCQNLNISLVHLSFRSSPMML